MICEHCLSNGHVLFSCSGSRMGTPSFILLSISLYLQNFDRNRNNPMAKCIFFKTVCKFAVCDKICLKNYIQNKLIPTFPAKFSVWSLNWKSFSCPGLLPACGFKGQEAHENHLAQSSVENGYNPTDRIIRRIKKKKPKNKLNLSPKIHCEKVTSSSWSFYMRLSTGKAGSL